MATFNKVFNFTDMFLRKKPEKDDLFEANISKKKKKKSHFSKETHKTHNQSGELCKR